MHFDFLDEDLFQALSVHIFACAFYRVKKESASSPGEVDDFYDSKNIEQTVFG